jgi:hypothetical protein
MKKKLKITSILLLSLLVLSEIVLRIFFDIGERPLYVKDNNCEYRLMPNQDVSRFHNSFTTDSYGMRSSEISKNDKKRILLFGDSVLNGGSKVDQTKLMSYVLEQKLNDHFQEKIKVCNISAGSWGPENAYQFLINEIDFEFDMIVLIFSSHDYHDNMHHRDVVGIEPAWPSSQPYLAITDMYSNYIVPKVKSLMGSRYDYLEGFDDAAINPGWDLFFDYSLDKNIPLLVYQHVDINELRAGEWTSDGEKLSKKIEKAGFPLVEGFGIEEEENYIDNIHINDKGHNAIAESLFKSVVKNIKE